MKWGLAKLKQKLFGSSKKKKFFNEKRIIRNQNFPFHATIIDYIISTNPWILEKLNQTCKYWFSKYRCCFVNRLSYKYYYFIKDGTTILQTKNDKILGTPIFNQIPPLKLFLTDSAQFDTSPIEREENIQHRILPVFEKVYLCRLKSLFIDYQNLSYDEWNFLTSSRTVTHVNLKESNVKHSNDNTYVYIEDLLLNLVNATEIYFLLSLDHFSNETALNLLNIEFQSKFQQFHLGVIPLTFDFDAFVLFAQKNAAKKAEFALYNHENHDTQLFLRLRNNYFGNAKNIFQGNYQNAKIWLTDRRYFNSFNSNAGNYETSASLITSF